VGAAVSAGTVSGCVGASVAVAVGAAVSSAGSVAASVGAAVSSAGAIGLMQMMPDTYEWLCKKTGDLCIPAMLYDPETNIRYGTYLLSFLYTRYGNWDTALAAYNAGLGNVDQWLEDPAYAGENGTLKEIPYKETRNYIKRVNEARRLYESLYPEAETSLGLRYKKI
jgi:soluble lytic murein transglycosylase-like protein